jgi:Ca2+/Na+ antiporter
METSKLFGYLIVLVLLLIGPAFLIVGYVVYDQKTDRDSPFYAGLFKTLGIILVALDVIYLCHRGMKYLDDK